MNILKRLWQKKDIAATDPFDLDTPLLYFSPQDIWTLRDACEGAQVFGAIGSGKTSGSGAAIAKAYLGAGFGGLWLCAKPGEREWCEQLARETGRQNSLIIFSPAHPWRFNFLNWELTREGRGSGQTENLVNMFSQIIEIVEGKVEVGGDQFWTRAAQELLRNAISLLAIAEGWITLEAINDLIASAPQSLEDVVVEKVRGEPIYGEWWKNSFCGQCLQKAENKLLTPREAHDLKVVRNYWTKNFAAMSDRTKSGIVATFSGVADILSHGIAHDLLCTETNLTPEVTYKEGAIIVLDLPILEFGEAGRIVQGILKFMYQQAILRRDAKQYSRPVFIWADESQCFVSSFDYQVQAVARSARLCTVYLTQSISNYYAMLGAHGREEANALLGNFQTKIFHANSDHNTNQYAADLIAQHWTVKSGGGFSTSADGSPGNSSSKSGNWSEMLAYKVLPTEFTTLRKGGPVHRLKVDAIIFQGGRVWQATQDTYLRTAFQQG